MKIFLTGSTGFVGSHILDEILKIHNPSDIGLFVRNPRKVDSNLNKVANVFHGDITDLESVLESIKTFNPDIIIHAAALADDWAPLSVLMEVNANGSRNIIKSINSVKKSIFIVHISTSGVYKRIQGVPLSETSPLDPKGNYQKSKLAAEKILSEEISKNKLRAVILRPPNVMGPRDLTQMTKICQAIKQNKFPLINNGHARHAWISAKDLAQGVILTFQNQEISQGKIYNLYSFDITIRELYNKVKILLGLNSVPKTYSYRLAYVAGLTGELFAKIRGKKSTLNRYRVRKFAKDRLYDDTKIRSELRFKPQATADDTIRETVTWLQDQNLV